MKETKLLLNSSLIIAGGINLLFTVFHFFFPHLFRWKETLSCLSRSNLAIFKTFYAGSLLILAMMFYLSIKFPVELIWSSFGKTLSFSFLIFYLIRICAEFLLFGYKGVTSIFIVLFCFIPAAIYMYAVLSKQEKADSWAI